MPRAPNRRCSIGLLRDYSFDLQVTCPTVRAYISVIVIRAEPMRRGLAVQNDMTSPADENAAANR
jgi:hypothetical protein